MTKIITTYTNPDADGICSAIALSDFLKKNGRNYIPCYSGSLDSETKFILSEGLDYGLKEIEDINVDHIDEVILVDTHHLNQIPKKINPELVVEIFDHHPSGNPEDFPNAIVDNRVIGSVCTIVAEKFKNSKYTISKDIADVLLYGLISNTLNLRAPSTCETDKHMYDWLIARSSLNINSYKNLFIERSKIQGGIHDFFERNTKVFDFRDVSIGIVQIETAKSKELLEWKNIEEILLSVQRTRNCDYLILSVVDIIKATTTLRFSSSKIKEIFSETLSVNEENNNFTVNKILLRKTDLVPIIKSFFA